jgi:hypothetical protein
MRSFELSGKRGDYRIMLREWDGGSGRPSYAFQARITNDEGDCLVQSGYMNTNYDEDNESTDTDPKTLLVVKPVDVLDRFDTVPNNHPLMCDRLVLTLAKNDELGREAVELMDPFFTKTKRWEKFRSETEK